MIQLKGCGTALVTPFRNGEVDFEAYTALVDRQVADGADFLVALATTGETPTLNTEEKIRLLEITRAHSGGRPVVVGCGSNSVPGTLANMALLEPYGPDAWLVVVPFYNKPTQEGMYLYYKAICEHSKLPVVIYNVPGRTGANMTAQTCLRIAAEVPGIIGIKEASGKMEQVSDILCSAPKGFAVLSGDDDLTFQMMKQGAAGVISVASNLAPALVSAMTSAALKGDFATAAALDARLQPLFKNCFTESNPIPAKAGLAYLGLCSDELRLPLTRPTAATAAIMKETLDALK